MPGRSGFEDSLILGVTKKRKTKPKRNEVPEEADA